MDAYEATRIVLSRIQSLDPENASKIMGLLLIQDHGEKEMIRLAFGPEALLHSVVLKARKDLGLLPPSTPSTPSSPSPSPFLLARQNSASRLLSGGGGGGGGSGLPSPSSWAPPPVFSRSSSSNVNGGSGINGVVDDLQGSDELISSNSSYGVSIPPPSSSCSSPSPFFGGDLIEEFQLHDQLSFLNDPAAAAAVSSPGSIHALQIPKGNGDLFYPDMAGDCRSPSSNGEGMLFPYAGMNWGMNSHHRRSYSAADRCLSSEVGSDFGWRPCLYFARGYCKNGSSCRFLHGLPDDAAAAAATMAGSKMDAVMEQQFHELLLRSKSQRLGSASQLMATAASFPYSPAAASPSSGKCINFLLQPQQQQQQNESQRVAAATAAAAALSLGGEEPHKFGRSRLERSDYAGSVNPGSRQIYLTFPADSTFREEDVANYFSIYGPVQDVRIPYQQKRMFGFVTFVYPETVKLILAKGNPHFVCDARVLVKPYKEKGKVPDKKQQQQQQADRGVFSGCSTPTGLDSKDPYDLQLLGASILYNSSQEVLLRKKLEEQQQAAELQQAIELQRRRFMGLQLLDLKARSLSSPAVSVTSSLPSPSPINPYTTTSVACPNATPSAPAEGSAEELPPPEASTGVAQAGATGAAATASAATAAAAEKQNTHAFLQEQPVNAAAGADKEDSARDGSPKDDGDFQESAEHNLPDSPFASPTKCSFAGDAFSVVSEAEASPVSASPNNSSDGCINNSSNNNNHLITSSLLPAPSTLDMASFNSCFFPIARFSSGHGAVGM